MLSPYARREAVSEGVHTVLAGVPFLGVVRPGIGGIERLSGALTNQSYKVTTDGGVYVLRLAGEGTSEYVDRRAEGHNARVAAGPRWRSGSFPAWVRFSSFVSTFLPGSAATSTFCSS